MLCSVSIENNNCHQWWIFHQDVLCSARSVEGDLSTRELAQMRFNSNQMITNISIILLHRDWGSPVVLFKCDICCAHTKGRNVWSNGPDSLIPRFWVTQLVLRRSSTVEQREESCYVVQVRFQFHLGPWVGCKVENRNLPHWIGGSSWFDVISDWQVIPSLKTWSRGHCIVLISGLGPGCLELNDKWMSKLNQCESNVSAGRPTLFLLLKV